MTAGNTSAKELLEDNRLTEGVFSFLKNTKIVEVRRDPGTISRVSPTTYYACLFHHNFPFLSVINGYIGAHR